MKLPDERKMTMDSTMVDYAIGKLNAAFESIAPTAIDLGERYVGYVVLILTVKTILGTIAGGLLLYLGYWLVKKGVSLSTDTSVAEIPLFIGGIVSLFVGFIMFLESITSIPTMIVANFYPLMYTIEHLVK